MVRQKLFTGLSAPVLSSTFLCWPKEKWREKKWPAYGPSQPSRLAGPEKRMKNQTTQGRNVFPVGPCSIACFYLNRRLEHCQRGIRRSDRNCTATSGTSKVVRAWRAMPVRGIHCRRLAVPWPTTDKTTCLFDKRRPGSQFLSLHFLCWSKESGDNRNQNSKLATSIFFPSDKSRISPN